MTADSGAPKRNGEPAESGRPLPEGSIEKIRNTITTDVVAPEVSEALKQERAQIDVNVLMVQLVNKSSDTGQIVAIFEQVLKLTQQYEEQRLKHFKERAEAIIDIRRRDPDEIEKRKNNRVRRILKLVLATSILAGGGGAVAAVLLGSNILVAGLLAVIMGLGVAVTAPLASGESMSSNDVIKIFGAVRGVFSKQTQQVPPTPNRRSKR